MARGRPSLSAAARGLGADHQRDRQRALATMREGQLCARCEIRGISHPLSRALIGRSADGRRYVAPLLDLDEFPGRAFGGPQIKRLSGRRCNRSHGAVLGNKMRGAMVQAMQSSRPWFSGRADPTCGACGKPVRRAPRSCEVCGAHYHPNHGEQRTCSRECGIAMRRRDHGTAGGRPRPRMPRPLCKSCGQPCASLGQVYCSSECRKEGRTASRITWPSSRLQHYVCRYCRQPRVAKATAQPREVCPARDCQAARLRVNRLVNRYRLSREQAEAEVTSYRSEGHHPGRSAALPGRTRLCASCGAVAAGFRWCESCRCISLNAKGKRCRNAATETSDQCDYHASLAA